ncbi:MAG: stress response translation initiation inhibitor YciH [archaeon]
MPEICPTCGLPQDLCVCAAIAKEGAKIVVKVVKRKFGSPATVIEGIENKEQDMKTLVKQLKAKLACGGTCKDGMIELMGDHRKKVKDILVSLGFAPDSIEVRQQVE